MSFELSFQKLSIQSPKEDIDALQEMAKATFADTFNHYRDEDLQAYFQESLSTEVLDEELRDPKNSYYFVLHHGERAGYLKWIFPSSKYLEHVELHAEQAF